MATGEPLHSKNFEMATKWRKTTRIAQKYKLTYKSYNVYQLAIFFQTLPLSKKKNYKISKCVKYLVGPGNGDKAIILSQKTKVFF